MHNIVKQTWQIVDAEQMADAAEEQKLFSSCEVPTNNPLLWNLNRISKYANPSRLTVDAFHTK